MLSQKECQHSDYGKHVAEDTIQKTYLETDPKSHKIYARIRPFG